MVLDVATAKDWKLTQLDVKSAFLHGDLQKQVFMAQPPGFEDPQQPEYVCHLHKAIYVLKQAPRAWLDKFTNYLLEYRFICSKADPSLFTYHQNGQTLVLFLYVDDIILTGNDPTFVQSLIDDLSDKFSMKNSEDLNYFLGIQV